MKTYTDYSEVCLDVQQMFKKYYNHSVKMEWVEAAKVAKEMAQLTTQMKEMANNRARV
jgi:hypothetical protein